MFGKTQIIKKHVWQNTNHPYKHKSTKTKQNKTKTFRQRTAFSRSVRLLVHAKAAHERDRTAGQWIRREGGIARESESFK